MLLRGYCTTEVAIVYYRGSQGGNLYYGGHKVILCTAEVAIVYYRVTQGENLHYGGHKVVLKAHSSFESTLASALCSVASCNHASVPCSSASCSHASAPCSVASRKVGRLFAWDLFAQLLNFFYLFL